MGAFAVVSELEVSGPLPQPATSNAIATVATVCFITLIVFMPSDFLTPVWPRIPDSGPRGEWTLDVYSIAQRIVQGKCSLNTGARTASSARCRGGITFPCLLKRFDSRGHGG